MQFLAIAIVAAVIIGLCRIVDVAFSKLFRNKAQHMSGMAVRANKRYGIFGVIFCVLGMLGFCTGLSDDKVLLWSGVVVTSIGAALAVYYLSFGIFYDGESMLVCRFGKKSMTYSFRDIEMQHLYIVTGGNIIVELNMADGTAISVHSNMDGTFPFLDTAFAGWCLLKGIDPQSCSFHDPSKSWWFPHEEEET